MTQTLAPSASERTMISLVRKDFPDPDCAAMDAL